MKIVIYTHYFLPIPGGVQTVVLELARGLSEWRPGKNEPDSAPLDVTVVTRTCALASEERSWPFRLVRCPSFAQLCKLLRNADVIHAAGPALAPMIIALALRKPLIVEHHGLQTACPNGSLFFEPTQTVCPGHYMAREYGKCVECNKSEIGVAKGIWRVGLTPLRRWLSNRARINITPTDWLAGVLKLNRMVTIHHGLRAPGSGTAAPPSNSTFAFQGRLVSVKGVAVLFSAAQRLREQGMDFRLKIIGDGPELNALRSQGASLDGRVEFLGHLPQQRLEEVLGEAAAVVMPSMGGEVFGLVAAENMARGKLVIVSDIGALKEVVGQTGLVFRAGNAEELASCMRKVLDNSEIARSLGPAAHTRAAQMFSRDAMVQAHLSLYREATTR